MSVRRLVPVVAIILVASIAALLWYVRRSPSVDKGPVVATVDGYEIAARELDGRMSRLLPNFSFHGTLPPERVLALRRTALDQLILEQLIYREAMASGAAVDEAAVEGQLAAVRKRFGTETEYYQALHDSGFTEREFRALLARDLVVEHARAAHVPPKPTDEEVRDYYQANAGKFERPEQVRLQELLVAVDPVADDAAVKAAERKARDLLRRIRAGEPFGTLARQHSNDPYRVKDGEVGWLHRGRLDPALEAAAFAAPIGKVQMVRADAGFFVFVALEREGARQLTEEEAAPLIVDRLVRARAADAERQWKDRLLAGGHVEILDAALRDAKPMELKPGGMGRAMARPGVAPASSH